MPARLLRLLLVTALLFGPVLATPVCAEQQGARKLKSRIDPAYPELARRMGIAGLVKLQLVISPDGKVKTAKPIGGHPILVQAATEAVLKWRFEPAATQTTDVVEVRFGSGRPQPGGGSN